MVPSERPPDSQLKTAHVTGKVCIPDLIANQAACPTLLKHRASDVSTHESGSETFCATVFSPTESHGVPRSPTESHVSH